LGHPEELNLPAVFARHGLQLVPEERPLRSETSSDWNSAPPAGERSPHLLVRQGPVNYDSSQAALSGVLEDGFVYRHGRRRAKLVPGQNPLPENPPAVGQGSLTIGRT